MTLGCGIAVRRGDSWGQRADGRCYIVRLAAGVQRVGIATLPWQAIAMGSFDGVTATTGKQVENVLPGIFRTRKSLVEEGAGERGCKVVRGVNRVARPITIYICRTLLFCVLYALPSSSDFSRLWDLHNRT